MGFLGQKVGHGWSLQRENNIQVGVMGKDWIWMTTALSSVFLSSVPACVEHFTHDV